MGGYGRIAVAIAQRDQRCVLEIRDTGPGIPADLREQVFEPFFTAKARGGGLGLPIARRTAELHGGTLTLACPETGGTCFTLTMPLPALAEAPPRAPLSEGVAQEGSSTGPRTRTPATPDSLS